MEQKKKISLNDLGVEEKEIIPTPKKGGIVTPKMAKGVKDSDVEDEIQVVDASEIAAKKEKEDIVGKNQQEMMDRLDTSLERNKQEMLETVINPAKDKLMAAKLEQELATEDSAEADPLKFEAISPQEKMEAISYKAESHAESNIRGVGAGSLDNLATAHLSNDDFDKLMEDLADKEEETKLTPEEEAEYKAWITESEKKFQEDVKTKLNSSIPKGKLRVSSASISAAKVIARATPKIANTASVPLVHTGRMITLSALVGDEIPKLRSDGYSSELEAARSIFTIIYNHDETPNKPENFDVWLKSICDWDVNQLYWGLYKATFGETNYLTYVCEECNNTFISEKDVDTMIRLNTNATKGAKERIDTIIKNANVGDISRLIGGEPTPISSEYAVSIKAPSIYGTVFEPSALEYNFRRKYGQLINLSSYIDKIFKIENGVAVPMETDVRDNVTKSVKMKIVTLSKIVATLTTDQSSRLTALVSNVLQYRNDTFEYFYPETECEGFYGPKKDEHGKTLMGKKCTHHFDEQTTLPSRDGRPIEISPLDLIFTREQLSTLANFTIVS